MTITSNINAPGLIRLAYRGRERSNAPSDLFAFPASVFVASKERHATFNHMSRKYPKTLDEHCDWFGMTPTYFHLLIESKVLPSPVEKNGDALWSYWNVSAAIRDLKTVYFADVRTRGLIKIGYTGNLFNRMERLRYELNSPIDLMLTMPGNADVETCIHQRFDHLRNGGLDGWAFECFWPGLDLFAYMDAL